MSRLAEQRLINSLYLYDKEGMTLQIAQRDRIKTLGTILEHNQDQEGHMFKVLRGSIDDCMIDNVDLLYDSIKEVSVDDDVVTVILSDGYSMAEYISDLFYDVGNHYWTQED